MKLLEKIPAADFERAFGAGVSGRVTKYVRRLTLFAPHQLDKAQELIDAKAVTISRLMELAPEGTIDPTPTLYNTTMYSVAGIMVVALLCNAMIKPAPGIAKIASSEKQTGQA